jgi:hypothetical protein
VAATTAGPEAAARRAVEEGRPEAVVMVERREPAEARWPVALREWVEARWRVALREWVEAQWPVAVREWVVARWPGERSATAAAEPE